MFQIAIVAVGYNRENSLIRLLKSLNNAEYGDDYVTLIVSLDNCGNSKVENRVKDFVWKYGEMMIRTFDQRQGLRKHILSCGEYLKRFDALIVLEDDVIVSPSFYMYAKSAVEYFYFDKNIAGISLYYPHTNWNSLMPFQADVGKSDVFFMQIAQSWGQIWLKEQWFEFVEWYEKNETSSFESNDIPYNVSVWPETSWLKYHNKYCIECDKFFVYPQISLSTCFSDAGEHCKYNNNTIQVPLLNSKRDFVFQPFDNDAVCYDAFYERISIKKKFNLEGGVCIDLYGKKKGYGNCRFWLSTQNLPFKVLKSYGLKLKPQENNIFFEIKGIDIKLYDVTQKTKTKKRKDISSIYEIISYYFNITIKWKTLVQYVFAKFIRGLKRK